MALAPLGSSPAHATPTTAILNGSFEAPIDFSPGGCPHAGCGTVQSGQNLDGWTVVGPSEILLLDNSYTERHGRLGFTAENGSHSLDLTGSGNEGVNGVQQTIETTAGTEYQLSFFVGNQSGRHYRLPSSISLEINGQEAGVFTNSTHVHHNVSWEKFIYDFIADGAHTTLTFLNDTGHKDGYAGLDNVSISALDAMPATPVPATLPLMATALGGLGFGAFRRWRHRNAA